MRLPNATIVKVEQEKITDYLLNREHPDNGGKADFFIALGYSRREWRALRGAFRKLAANYLVAQSMESVHGKKYIVDGALETPAGKSPTVRTIWIIDSGQSVPRLVTAYPARKSDD